MTPITVFLKILIHLEVSWTREDLKKTHKMFTSIW